VSIGLGVMRDDALTLSRFCLQVAHPVFDFPFDFRHFAEVGLLFDVSAICVAGSISSNVVVRMDYIKMRTKRKSVAGTDRTHLAPLSRQLSS
jgi:hypothetical protein